MNLDGVELAASLRWEVRRLPLPKRCKETSGIALGTHFCLYNAQGRGFPRPYLLLDGADEPTRLELEKRHFVETAADGWLIGGAPGPDRSSKACAWRVAADGTLERSPLWREHWGASGVTSACGDVFVGYAFLASGRTANMSAVMWRDGEVVVLGSADETTCATAVHADAQAGTVWWVDTRVTTNRAVMWHGDAGTRIDLHPAGYTGSEPLALDDGQQVGFVTPLRQVPGELPRRAALWEGSAASFTDLTPEGAIAAEASGVALGLQFGHFTVPAGGMGTRTRAIAWAGSPEIAIDLHGLLEPGVVESEVRMLRHEPGCLRLLGSAWTGPRTELGAESGVIWEAALPE